LELARSQEILRRFLPEAPATVLDLGGGAGVYSAWLGSLGYKVTLLDLVRKHTVQARGAGVTAVQGDARALPFRDARCDAALLMGPLYHLTEREERVRALTEARRAVRPGGVVIAAAICRYASLIPAMATGLLDEPHFMTSLGRTVTEGQYRNFDGAVEYFTTAYFHLPEDLRAEMTEAGLAVAEVLAVEGPVWLAKDFEQAWADERQRKRLLEIAQQVEKEPALWGVSPHLLAAGRRSGQA
jgi:SAM-dependent methyltransferase